MILATKVMDVVDQDTPRLLELQNKENEFNCDEDLRATIEFVILTWSGVQVH